MRQAEIADGVYMEGAVAYLEVIDETGAQVARVEDPLYHVANEFARFELPAGRYVIKTFVRPCEAACSALDGPSDGCELAIDLAPAAIIDLRVERRPGRPCELST